MAGSKVPCAKDCAWAAPDIPRTATSTTSQRLHIPLSIDNPRSVRTDDRRLPCREVGRRVKQRGVRREGQQDRSRRIGEREKLKPRAGDEPHWQRLRQGVYLGYRPSKKKAGGTWFARFYDAEANRNVRKRLDDYGTLSGHDVFKQAKADAETWAETVESGGERGRDMVTVEDPCKLWALGKSFRPAPVNQTVGFFVHLSAMSNSLALLISLLLKAGAGLVALNEIRGLVLAGPVIYGMYQSGGTAMAIWLGVCSLGGIALSVIVPLIAAKKIGKYVDARMRPQLAEA
jgi:hypothetical protein